MAYSLEAFCADARESLKAHPGAEGAEEVRQHLERFLASPECLESLKRRLGDPIPPGRHTLHHDPETDIYILAYRREREGGSLPHDHGDHWVVYGNATNYTDMKEWRRLDDGAREGYAELAATKSYRVGAGQAALFPAGAIHSIAYPEETHYVRVTGGDVESAETLRFDPQKKTVSTWVREGERKEG